MKRALYYISCTLVIGFMGITALGMLIEAYLKYGFAPLIALAVLGSAVAGMIFFHDA